MALARDQPPKTQPWEPPRFTDIQMQIGRLLRRQYEVSEELPERLLALLKQATGEDEP